MNDKLELARKEAEKELERFGFTKENESDFNDYLFQRMFWKELEGSATPPECVEEREGFKDKITGQPTILEYVPEEYTLSELNRLFPGWWTTKMKRSSHEEVVQLQAALVEGYLVVPYITPQGYKVRKIWAIAGSEIKFQQGTKIPVDIANEFKGARTEWIRIAGKWLGIGLDIYHQHITTAMRSMFEDRVRTWRPYATHWINIAKSTEKGKAFRTLLKTMPQSVQVMRAEKAIRQFPNNEQAQLWSAFGKMSNADTESKEKFETFLTKLEHIAQTKFNKEST